MIFAKPIATKQVFKFNLADTADFKDACQLLVLLTKKSVLKNSLNDYWHRFDALEPSNLAKNLYSIEVIHFLKRILKTKTGLSFNEQDILNSVHQIIITKGDSIKPKTPIVSIKKKAVPSIPMSVNPTAAPVEIIE